MNLWGGPLLKKKNGEMSADSRGACVAIVQGLKFAMREGGKTVGAGVISEVLKDVAPAA